MPLILHFHGFHCTSSFHRDLRLYASNPKKPNRFNRTEPQARDRVIDFGKHNGRMLGSLPSSYIRWLSRTLRARDFEHWARLADEVLADPVYADRVEWESAQRVLGGDGGGGSPAWRCDSPAKEFAELCDRFGWDVQDRHGWARLDFDLLGTSHGGRIPRISAVAVEDVGKRRSYGVGNDKEEDGRGRSVRETRSLILGNEKKSGNFGGNSKRIITKGSVIKENREENVKETMSLKEIGVLSNRDFGNVVKESEGRVLSSGCTFLVEEEEEVEQSAREKRRERRTLKREQQQMQVFRKNVGKKEDKQERADDQRSYISQRSLGNKEVCNPFPGRSALLDKINKRRQED